MMRFIDDATKKVMEFLPTPEGLAANSDASPDWQVALLAAAIKAPSRPFGTAVGVFLVHPERAPVLLQALPMSQNPAACLESYLAAFGWQVGQAGAGAAEAGMVSRPRRRSA